jgi:hypothetical protein
MMKEGESNVLQGTHLTIDLMALLSVIGVVQAFQKYYFLQPL